MNNINQICIFRKIHGKYTQRKTRLFVIYLHFKQENRLWLFNNPKYSIRDTLEPEVFVYPLNNPLNLYMQEDEKKLFASYYLYFFFKTNVVFVDFVVHTEHC